MGRNRFPHSYSQQLSYLWKTNSVTRVCGKKQFCHRRLKTSHFLHRIFWATLSLQPCLQTHCFKSAVFTSRRINTQVKYLVSSLLKRTEQHQYCSPFQTHHILSQWTFLPNRDKNNIYSLNSPTLHSHSCHLSKALQNIYPDVFPFLTYTTLTLSLTY